MGKLTVDCQLLWVGVGPHNDHDPSRGGIVAPCIHVQTHLCGNTNYVVLRFESI